MKNDILNAEFDVDERLYLESTGLDWDDSVKIEKVISSDKDNEDKEKDPQEKNR